MKDFLLLKDLETGLRVEYRLGDVREGGSQKIIYSKKIKLQEKNVKKHNFSFGRGLHKTFPDFIIATLEQGDYGWFSVNTYSDPYFGHQELYNSYYDLGSNTPISKQREKAKEIYVGLVKILKEGNFNLHIVPGPVLTSGELNSSKIFLTED